MADDTAHPPSHGQPLTQALSQQAQPLEQVVTQQAAQPLEHAFEGMQIAQQLFGHQNE